MKIKIYFKSLIGRKIGFDWSFWPIPYIDIERDKRSLVIFIGWLVWYVEIDIKNAFKKGLKDIKDVDFTIGIIN